MEHETIERFLANGWRYRASAEEILRIRRAHGIDTHEAMSDWMQDAFLNGETEDQDDIIRIGECTRAMTLLRRELLDDLPTIRSMLERVGQPTDDLRNYRDAINSVRGWPSALDPWKRLRWQLQGIRTNQVETAATPAEPIMLDGVRLSYDGITHTLHDDQATYMRALIAARGLWVSSTKLKKPPHNLGRPDRIKDRLPDAIQAIIESETGSGSRLACWDKWNK